MTRVVLHDLASTGVLAIEGAAFVARDVAVRGLAGNTPGNLGVGFVASGESVDLERVVVEENGVLGVYADPGAVARISDSLFRTNVGTADNERRQLQVLSGTLEAQRVAAVGCGGACLVVDGASGVAAVEDVVLADGDYGLVAQFGSSTTASRALVGRAPLGVLVMNAELTAADLSLREVGSRDEVGLSSAMGAMVTAERVRCIDTVTGCAGAGDGSLTVSDLWATSVRSAMPFGFDSRALTVGHERGVLVVRRALVERAQDVGLAVGLGAMADVEDIVIRDSIADDSHAAPKGWGVAVQDASVRIARGRIERVQAHGVSARDGATLDLEDMAFHSLRSEVGTGYRGFAMYLFGNEPISCRLARVEVREARDTGLYFVGDTDVEASDVLVVDTAAVAGPMHEGEHGRGIEVSFGARLGLTSAHVERARDVGLSFFHEGTTADLRSVAVVGTLERECVDSGCPDEPGGMGVGVYERAAVTMNDFLIRGSNLCGVHVATEGSLDLSDGTVEGHPLGACVQVDGYDVGRLASAVRYVDNDVNLEATTLPVPEPVATGDVGL